MHSEAEKEHLSEVMRKRCEEQGTNLCGRGKRGYYQGYYCQSSWELAYVIYCLEHGIVVERNKQGFSYVWEGKTHTYFPDFYLPESDRYVEIKGYYNEKTKVKEAQFDQQLIILKKNEMKPILEYVIEKYGKDFINQYDKAV